MGEAKQKSNCCKQAHWKRFKLDDDSRFDGGARAGAEAAKLEFLTVANLCGTNINKAPTEKAKKKEKGKKRKKGNQRQAAHVSASGCWADARQENPPCLSTPLVGLKCAQQVLSRCRLRHSHSPTRFVTLHLKTRRLLMLRCYFLFISLKKIKYIHTYIYTHIFVLTLAQHLLSLPIPIPYDSLKGSIFTYSVLLFLLLLPLLVAPLLSCISFQLMAFFFFFCLLCVCGARRCCSLSYCHIVILSYCHIVVLSFRLPFDVSESDSTQLRTAAYTLSNQLNCPFYSAGTRACT